MPITPAAIGPMTAALVNAGCIGASTPKLATGVVMGVIKWTKAVTVNCPGVGTLAPGVGVAALVVPSPALFVNLTAGFASNTMLGVMSPMLITGLSTGLSLTFAQGQVVAPMPTVGVGSAVAQFSPPPATPMLVESFASAGMDGPTVPLLANAISTGLVITFSALVLPMVVAGGPNIVPGGGVGVGTII